MLRRFLFGLSLLLVAVSAIGAIGVWLADGEYGPWVAAFALIGVAALVAALALALRDLLQGVWRVSKAQSRQQAKAVATLGSLQNLNAEAAARDDVILTEIFKLETRINELEAQRIRDVADRTAVFESLEQHSAALASTLGRIENDQGKVMMPALKRLEAVEAEGVLPALERLEAVEAEEVIPALRRLEATGAKTKPVLRNIEREQAAGYRQVEALASLLAALDLRSPLPPMRNTWAMDPDSAAYLIGTVFARRPGTVLEVGSGVSTVLVAQALRSIDSGRFRSLDHDPRFLEETLRLLKAQDLDGSVELVEAGLVDVEIGAETWKWYSPQALDGLDGVDLVIVDGPPGRTGKDARYPAVPLTAPLLNKGALIFVDDADREDEQRVVERWLGEFPLVALDVPKLEKGAALLEWNS